MNSKIVFFEIPASDFDRAVKFYNGLFDIKMETSGNEKEKMAFFPGGSGAVSKASGFNPSKDGTTVTFDAGDKLDEALERATELGGSVIQPKTKIECDNRDSFALIADTEGNRIGLYGK